MSEIKRHMSVKEIVKAFDSMILGDDSVLLLDFIKEYPEFVESYVDVLLRKLSIINRATCIARKDE